MGEHLDVILNFVGVGNPAQAALMGASIFDVTLKYDKLALDYVREDPRCRYILGATRQIAKNPCSRKQSLNWYPSERVRGANFASND